MKIKASKRKKFYTWIIISLLAISFCEIALSKTYTGQPRTIAHDFLDMEREFGTKKHHYEYINKIINRAIYNIDVKKKYTTEEAIKILATIDLILKDEGFKFRNNLLLSKGLDTKIIDCDNYCTLYTAIAEVLKLPIIPVYAPNHSFIRFNFKDGSYLNWECTEGKHYSNAWYIKKLNISSKSISQGVYLISLTRNEFLAVEFNNIGAHLMLQKKYTNAIQIFNKAIEMYPRFSSAYHNRGTSYYAIKMKKEAFLDLHTALGLDPMRASTHNSVGDIFFDLKEYNKALSHFNKSIKLNPTNYVPYYSIGLIMKIQGKRNESRRWIKKSQEIKRRYH